MHELIDIPTASDETLGRLLRRLDGAWSPLTRAFLVRFKTDRLDLNDNWAAVPQHWSCPACRREKRDLARPSSEGVLLCHLDLHHDHLRDAGKAILRARNPLPEDDVAQRRALLSAFEACKTLFERFCDTLVCSDCNAADGEAKRGLKDLPGSFSFAPAEIAGFISVRPNMPHAVDLVAARAAWELARADFEDTLAFAALVAERIARGRHVRQGAPYAGWRRASGNAEIALALLRDATGKELWGLSEQVANRSVRRDGFASTTRMRVRPRQVEPPTAEAWAALDARQARTRGWRTAPADWRCPVCDRDRQTIPRVAKSGAWTAGLHDFMVFEREHELESYHWRVRDPEDLVFRSHARIWLCQDCRQIVTDVKTQDRTLSGDHLSIHDLRALAPAAEPHRRHEIDLAAAVARARANQSRDESAREYFAHFSACRSAAGQYWLARQELRLPEGEALLWLADRLGADLNTVDDAEWLQWVIREGDRLSEEGRADFAIPPAHWV